MQNAYFAKPACLGCTNAIWTSKCPGRTRFTRSPDLRRSPRAAVCRGIFFDALVSIGSYHYFGTDDLYLGYYLRFVKTGGQIGMVLPGLAHGCETIPPPHLEPHWKWDSCAWRSQAWWRRHWETAGLVTVESLIDCPTVGETGCAGTKRATAIAARRGWEAQMTHRRRSHARLLASHDLELVVWQQSPIPKLSKPLQLGEWIVGLRRCRRRRCLECLLVPHKEATHQRIRLAMHHRLDLGLVACGEDLRVCRPHFVHAHGRGLARKVPE